MKTVNYMDDTFHQINQTQNHQNGGNIMSVQVINGHWYDQDGNQLSKAEKKEVRRKIRQDLDKELGTSKFERVLKALILKIIRLL